MIKDIFKRVYVEEAGRMKPPEDLRRRIAVELRLPRESKKMSWFPFALVGVGVCALALAILPSSGPVQTSLSFGEKIDDWAYDAGTAQDAGHSATTRRSSSSSRGSTLSVDSVGSASALGLSDLSNAPSSAERIGLSAGGAEDANAFRDDIENGYVPLPTDLTYEGLFSEYYFDTADEEACAELFCPSYAMAVVPDPISGETDYYLSVGLNSGMTEADLVRKPLNVVVVVDISGSMGSPFDRYAYDAGAGVWDGEDENRSKMEVAQEALVDLLGHLEPEDRVGIVLFDDEAVLAKPLRLVGETDMEEIEEHVRDLSPQGGTDMSAGMDLGTSLFDDAGEGDYENRIIFFTDAQPNAGDLSASGMLGRMKKNANDDIYATFIGIGLDFQTELVEAVTKTRGANYYAVHSPAEFRERMDEGFDYMVTPLVFDLRLELEADGFDIEQVYGSPDADRSTGQMLSVNTLFPSLTKDGETKGGLVLVKLKKIGARGDLALNVSYEDRDGNAYENEAAVSFGNATTQYDNAGIRKAVWLARYADLLKNWMIDAREEETWWSDEPLVNEDDGIVVPSDVSESTLSRWEQQSVALTVDDAYREVFRTFSSAFVSEVAAIGDETMEREADILEKLAQ